jgi:hypothetical protein
MFRVGDRVLNVRSGLRGRVTYVAYRPHYHFNVEVSYNSRYFGSYTSEGFDQLYDDAPAIILLKRISTRFNQLKEMYV